MSFAWEVTPDDVQTVLDAHGVTCEDAEELFDEFICGSSDTIEAAVLAYTDFDDQCAVALSEIEDILIEEARVRLPKKWKAP